MVRHQTVILYVGLAAVFVLTVWAVGAQRAADARADTERARGLQEASLRFCETGNERWAVLRDFMAPYTAEPDERQYAFIADPALRQGVIDQQRRSRAELRDRVAKTFAPRDCATLFPPPS